MSGPEWIPAAEAARRWGVRVDYLRRLAQRVDLPRRRVGRVIEVDWTELTRRYGVRRRMEGGDDGKGGDSQAESPDQRDD